MTKVAILGGGAWGSALACISARAGHETSLWCRSSEQAQEITNSRSNSRYLGDLQLDDKIAASDDLSYAVTDAKTVLISIPAQSLSSVITKCQAIHPEATLVTTCKGIDQITGKLPSDTVRAIFPNHKIAALSGPSFAHDVVRGLPTAVTIASDRITSAEDLSKKLSTNTFRCYASDDLKGTELGGALKNVLALAVGATRGMQLGASAEAALMARGFAEISRLAVSLGAQSETLMGLSGLGDITLTCSTPQSRNFRFGMALGSGESHDGLKLAEGAFTASVALRLANELGIDVPITSAIVDVLEKRVTAREAVEQLLTRPLKREN